MSLRLGRVHYQGGLFLFLHAAYIPARACGERGRGKKASRSLYFYFELLLVQFFFHAFYASTLLFVFFSRWLQWRLKRRQVMAQRNAWMNRSIFGGLG